MPVRVTGRPRLGPLRFNYSAKGLTSVALKLGPITWRLWSRTGFRGLSSVDLPGPWSWRARTARPTAAQRQALAARTQRRRAIRADLAAAGLLAAAVLAAPHWVLIGLGALTAATTLAWLAGRRTV
jgi:hypothetical protein